MHHTTSESVESIFDALIDLPREQRAAELEKRCGADRQLRQRVQQLLDADEQNERDDTFSGPAGEMPSVELPLRVGGYLIRGIAGEGGMGAVYDAAHEATGRRAAIKLIRAGIATASGRERFQIESETLARLNHPGIAQLYDAGLAEVAWADGSRRRSPFIAMEFVADATSITRSAAARALPLRDRIELMEHVVRSVHHAHQRGVIHRDLKPGNVLVGPDGQPKIVDFGIARLADATAEGITVTGQVLGTIRYMSPEQAGGDPHLVDIRTDIYSLGAILYELLADRPLLDADSGSTLAAAIQLIGLTPPRLASVKPECTGDLDAIVHKAIEKNPDDRYASAAAFADDLQAFLDGREVSARAPTSMERLVRFVRQNKGKVAAAAIVVLSLMAGGIGATWGMISAQHARKAEADQRVIAEREAANAQAAEADAKAFGRFLQNRILAAARPKDTHGGLGVDVTVAEAMRAAETHLEEDFKDRPAAEARARQAIGITWRHRGDLVPAEQHLRRAMELSDATMGEQSPLSLDLRNSLIVLMGPDRVGPETVTLLNQLIEGLEKTAGRQDHRTAAAMYNLAFVHNRLGNLDEAIKVYEEVRVLRHAIFGPDSIEALQIDDNLSGVYFDKGEAERAFALKEGVVSRFTAKLGAEHPQTLMAQRNLASLHKQAGQVQRAAEMLEELIPRLKATLGDHQIVTIGAMRDLAECHLQLGQTDRAVAEFREMVAAAARQRSERSPDTALALAHATRLLLAADQFAPAEEFARKLLDLQQELAPDSSPLYLAQCQLGLILHGQNQLQEAEPLLKSGLEGLDRQPPEKLTPREKAAQQRAREALGRAATDAGPADAVVPGAEPTTRP